MLKVLSKTPLVPQCRLFHNDDLLISTDSEVLNIELIPLINQSNIKSIKSYKNLLFILTDSQIKIYKEYQLKETLPFNNVIEQSINHDVYSIQTSNLNIITYRLFNNELEMINTYKSQNKIIHFQTAQSYIIFITSSYDCYSLNLQTSTVSQFHKLPNSFFKSFIKVITSNDKLIIFKNNQYTVFNKDFSLIFTGILSNTPIDVLVHDSLLYIIDKDSLSIRNLTNNKEYHKESVNSPNSIVIVKEKLYISTSTSLISFQIPNIDELLEFLEAISLDEAIDYLTNVEELQKFDKLRHLNTVKAVKYFNDKEYKRAFDLFIEFIASPITVLKLFPQEIAFKIGESSNEPPTIAIQQLTRYLSDIRRKLNLLDTVDTLKQEYFINDTNSLQDIKEIIDTSLFNCYTKLNSKLIGSLIRVGNHCNQTIVETYLKENGYINELIDFYYKSSKHELALSLISDFDQKVKYLSQLDDLDLILKNSNDLISQNHDYIVELFINSKYSETFNKFKIFKYLSYDDDLVRIYLESLIWELKDTSKLFHNKLIEIYLKTKKYDSLAELLKLGNYEYETVLKLLEKDEEPDQEVVLLKLIVLEKIGSNDEILTILLNLNNLELIIEFLNNHSQNLELFEKTIKSYLNDSNAIQEIITKITFQPNLSQLLKILPDSFQINQISINLINVLRNDIKSNVQLQLLKNLYESEIFTKEYVLSDLSNSQVDINNKICLICHKSFLNNQILRYSNNDLIHLTCQELYESQSIPKIQTKTVGEYLDI